MTQTEKATNAADLPHEYKGTMAAPECRVCGGNEHAELHKPAAREVASQHNGVLPRELGS